RLLRGQPSRPPIDRTFLNSRSQESPLRVLLVSANTKPMLPRAEKEVEAIAKVIRAVKENYCFPIEFETLAGAQANLGELTAMLEENRFDIVHFAGHCSFEEDDEFNTGLLLWSDPSRVSVEVCCVRVLRRILKEAGVSLFYCSGCESGRQARGGSRASIMALRGIVEAGLTGGVATVIGFREEIQDGVAFEAAVEFYTRFFEVGDAELALWQVRRTLFERGDHGLSHLGITLFHNGS
ncbi:MAG TPA: CHAT domain-containing protein, partial [Terriglobia bacterium]|nr:CHAT domain-containing protein [Terriglobia bacterium]